MSFARRVATALLASPLVLAGCAGGADEKSAPPSDAPACPTTPINVVVSVDQWGDIVSDLAGACANVTTLLASSSVDPHDYEPSPADAAKFQGAQLVVVNGGHYDEWANKLAAGSAPNAPVIDAVAISGVDAGHDGGGDGHAGGDDHDHGGEANPHIWYRPDTVTGVADAVTAELTKLSPSAGDYFAKRRTAFGDEMKPYQDLIAKIKAGAAGKSYAATETVFDYMGTALGLQDKTPAGYQAASQNETDPSPADLDAYLTLLRNKGVDVLIFNSQTEGSVPDQIRTAAQSGGVPVVEVTETVAPGAKSFEAWQVDQLTSLAKALGVSV
jgi:zinc/manganese transport system substrate-binding protein